MVSALAGAVLSLDRTAAPHRTGLRVLVVASGFPSPGRQWKSPFNARAVEQVAARAEVQVVTLRAWVPSRSFLEREDYSGIPVRRYAVPLIPYRNGTSLFAARLQHELSTASARTVVRSERRLSWAPDLVHSISIGLTSWLGARIAESWGVPHVAQAVGGDMNRFVPKFRSNASLGVAEGQVSAIIANSRGLADQARSRFPWVRSVPVIYRGVDHVRFSPVRRPDYARRRVLYLGGFPTRWRHRRSDAKGGDILLDAWSRLDEKNLAPRLELQLYGPGSDRAEVARWREGLRYPDRVTIGSAIEASGVPNLMENMELLVLPSRWEGLPNVVLEALASGRPVVAADVGGVPEVLAEGSGLLVQPENVSSLQAALLAMDGDSPYQRIADAVWSLRHDLPDAAAYGDSLIEVYESVCQ